IFQLNPGIDFSSGSRVEILADESITTEEVESDLESLGLEAKSIVLQVKTKRSRSVVLIQCLKKIKLMKLTAYMMIDMEKSPVSVLFHQLLVKSLLKTHYTH